MCDYYVIFTSSEVKRKKRNDEEEEVKRDEKHFMKGKERNETRREAFHEREKEKLVP